MSVPSKKCLDPLVECSEAADTHESADYKDSEDIHVDPDPTLCASTSRSTETVTLSTEKPIKEGKRKRAGSRLSLASLFSFTSQGGRDKERERSKSGWSCSGAVGVGSSSMGGGGGSAADDSSSLVMSSVSATDLRSNGSGSIGNRRFRGSDAGSLREEADESSELLLSSSSAGGTGGVTDGNGLEQTEHEPHHEDELAVAGGSRKRSSGRTRECPLCCMRQPLNNYPRLLGCSHRSCRLCLMQYVEMEIMENRVEVTCPECPNHLHPTDIKNLVGGRSCLIEKYEQFSVRRYLLTEPDTRWCPTPDCGYAVIANSCAACPQLKCSREECGALFCYHCKGPWHANQTCDEARRLRGGPLSIPPSDNRYQPNVQRRVTSSSLDVFVKPNDMKPCPRCGAYIVKLDDGSCNHMVCALCHVEFCWLCLKEISDLHYLSPTGCTFWGKKPWTRKKKLLWQVGTLIGAPVGIALIAGISIPGIIFGVPILVGRKVHQRFLHHRRAKRRAVTAACVVGSLVVSPVLAVMAVGVGVPIMLAYVYGVVPLSLCRNGGCGLSNARPSNRRATFLVEDEEMWSQPSALEKSQLLVDADRQLDGTSIAPGMSIQSGSISTNHVRLNVQNYAKRARSPSMSSSAGSGRLSPDARCNYEDASVKAMSGSQCHYYCDDKSVHTMGSTQEAVSICEDVASTKALAGSAHDSKSLCERSGRHRHNRHDQACAAGDDAHAHPAACATPSNCSSVEHPRSVYVDETMPLSLRRRLESRTTSIDSHQQPSSVSAGRSVHVVASVHPVPNSASNHDSSPSGAAASSSTANADSSFDVEAAHQQPCSSRSAHFTGSSPAQVTSSDSREEADPFRIRTLLDNMKQMVAVDVPQERPYEPSVRSTGGPAGSLPTRMRRSGSGKSLVTVTTHASIPPESQLLRSDSASISRSSKPKRGFFQSLFGRNKK